jgi:hypothetical protein
VRTRRARIAFGAGAVAIVALAVGLGVWLSTRGSKPTLSNAAYAQLFGRAVVRETRIAVLDQWPKPPYQSFHDNFGDQCFQWFDRPAKALYTLCFKNGLLEIKSTE